MRERTRREINGIVAQVLCEAGLTSPPVSIEEVLEFLDVNRGFYDLDDPGFTDKWKHKIKVGRHKFVKIARKIRLAALWLPNRSEIMVDSSLPKPKKEWASFHDSVHTMLPWHKPFFLGDTAQTLDPDFQEKLESEANYGASYLMFCGERFAEEALDTIPSWRNIEKLRKRYKKSMVTTSRRYVCYTHDTPMAMLVSTPRWQITPDGQDNRWRHFVGSGAFLTRFACIGPAMILGDVDRNTNRRRGGLVGDFGLCLPDVDGDLHEFRAECFYNQYDILTLVVYERPLK